MASKPDKSWPYLPYRKNGEGIPLRDQLLAEYEQVKHLPVCDYSARQYAGYVLTCETRMLFTPFCNAQEAQANHILKAVRDEEEAERQRLAEQGPLTEALAAEINFMIEQIDERVQRLTEDGNA